MGHLVYGVEAVRRLHTVKASYNGGGKSAPPFRNIEIIRYRYLLYKHPYMGPTKSTEYLPSPTPFPNQSPKSLCFKFSI